MQCELQAPVKRARVRLVTALQPRDPCSTIYKVLLETRGTEAE